MLSFFNRTQEDIITCNGTKSAVLSEGSKSKPVDDDFVYDLYCDINQENLPTPKSITKPFKMFNKKETESLPTKDDKKLATVNPLSDFQSSFGHATTNIVGCDWKSVQDYLTCDLNEEMPEWWRRGGEIETEYGNVTSALDL